MTIPAGFWPMGGKREVCPYTANQKLLDIRPSSTSAVSGSIEILADGRFKLELEAAGGAGSGWQDENVWAGGGSAAAIVVEVILTAGKYLYSVPGKTKAFRLLDVRRLGRYGLFQKQQRFSGQL